MPHLFSILISISISSRSASPLFLLQLPPWRRSKPPQQRLLGPAVPPKLHSYLCPGCTGGCTCGCSSYLLELIFNLVLTVVVSVSLLALLFWQIFRPNLVKFRITNIELTQFKFTTTNTLNYNLKLNLTIRNPNKKIGVYYDRLEARAFYNDQRLGVADVAPFYQGHKNTSVVSPAFAGQKVVGSELSSFNKEKASGVFDIKVKLYLRVRFKLGSLKTFRFKPKVKCDLNVPSSSKNGGSSAKFQTTKCDIDWNIF